LTTSKQGKRLAVDFDGTLFHTKDTFPGTGKQRSANLLVSAYVRHKKAQGWTIVLNTMREKGKGLEAAVAACDVYHIPIDEVNTNDPDKILKFGDSRKIDSDLSIDDRQVGLIGWLLRHLG
jgi:hypothetical protein